MNTTSSRRAKRQTADINITPLVDVLLILLAVLMLVMPLFVKRLPVDLPQTALGGTPTPIVSLAIAVRADGSLLLNGAATPLDEVLGLITHRTTLELAVDKDVRYDELAQFIAKAQSRAPKEILLLTR